MQNQRYSAFHVDRYTSQDSVSSNLAHLNDIQPTLGLGISIVHHRTPRQRTIYFCVTKHRVHRKSAPHCVLSESSERLVV